MHTCDCFVLTRVFSHACGKRRDRPYMPLCARPASVTARNGKHTAIRRMCRRVASSLSGTVAVLNGSNGEGRVDRVGRTITSNVGTHITLIVRS